VRNDIYPKDIPKWWGLPGDMDAALQWENGKTYFFRDGSYWRFNDQRFMIDSGSPPFPRDAQDWLFGCYASNQVQVGEFEEQLVSERTISANPFLNEETQEDFGVGDEVLDVVPFDERGEVLEWGSNPKSTQTRIPRNNQ